MNNNLITTNQNAKLALCKSKSLLNITNSLLAKKDIGQLVQSFKFKPFIKEKGHSDSVYSVAISLDGKTIVSGSEDGTLKLWDIRSGECIYTSDHAAKVSIDKDGYFTGEIDEYVRVSEAPLTQRKLTDEEIKYFRKKGNFLEIVIRKRDISIIDINEDEIRFRN